MSPDKVSEGPAFTTDKDNTEIDSVTGERAGSEHDPKPIATGEVTKEISNPVRAASAVKSASGEEKAADQPSHADEIAAIEEQLSGQRKE